MEKADSRPCDLPPPPPPLEAVTSWPCALSSLVNSKSMTATILKNCATAATARAQLSHGDYSMGKTFWVGTGQSKSNQPTTTLERLALQIFHDHLKRLLVEQQESSSSSTEKPSSWSMENVNLECSGAEWWTLYMDGDDGGVGWHWDKDYHAELQQGINVHPLLGTISNFSSVGAPTMLVQHYTAGPIVSPDDYTTCRSNGQPITKAYISKVIPGKHAAFDGRLLHAAPVEVYDRLKETITASSSSSSSSSSSKLQSSRGPRPKRATFLVNIWINHKPHDAVPLESCIASRLSHLKITTLDLSKHKPCLPFQIMVLPKCNNDTMAKRDIINKSTKSKQSKSSNVKTGDSRSSRDSCSCCETSDVEPFEWPLTSEHTLVVALPMKTLTECWEDSKNDMFEVIWSKGTQRPYIDYKRV